MDTGITGVDIFKMDAEGRRSSIGTCCRWSAARTTPSHGSPRTSLSLTRTACS